MAYGALPFAKEDLLAAELAFARHFGIQPAEHRQLWRRRKIEHVLGLRHVRNHTAREFLESFLHGANRIAIEIGRPLLELRKVLDRPQAALRAVNLLIEYTAQADRIETEAPLLGANVGTQVKLTRGVSVHMTIETGNAERRMLRLAIVGGVEFLLRQGREQQAQTFELHLSQDL